MPPPSIESSLILCGLPKGEVDEGPSRYLPERTMAICEYCQQEMNEADGCKMLPVKTIDGPFDPIRYGSERQYANIPPLPGQHQHGVLVGDPPRCHDCAALPGQYHHVGCDYEECPRCHEQLIGCECDPTGIPSSTPQSEIEPEGSELK